MTRHLARCIGRLLATLAVLASAAAPLASQQPSRLVILVRHAEKADEPRADPPLSETGRARAAALAAALADTHVDAVIATQFLRTRATAEPTAAARGLTLLAVAVSGGLAQHVQAVADAVRGRPAGETILVVGHSNTIPAIIGALGGPKLADLCDAEYDWLFVLDVPDAGPARLVRAHYGAPDPPGAAACR